MKLACQVHQAAKARAEVSRGRSSQVREATGEATGSPIKRLLSTAKTFPMQEKGFFQALLFSVIGIVTIPVISIFSMSAFAAPVTHQDQGLLLK
jgi:hypothetical protein